MTSFSTLPWAHHKGKAPFNVDPQVANSKTAQCRQGGCWGEIQ